MASPAATARTAMSATGSHARGLSLVEVLVGLVILSVLLGAVVLAFPRSEARRAELESGRTLALLQLACERAELSGYDIGIAIGEHGLAFGPWRAEGWRPLANSPNEALRPRLLAAGQHYSLRIDARDVALPDLTPAMPQFACAADGMLPAFTLDIHGPGDAAHRLVSDGDGGLAPERPDAQ